MTRRNTSKTMCKNAKRIVSTIRTIPRELASDIMARVAANSFTDIANVKLSNLKCCRPKLDNTKGLEKVCSTKSTTNELCNTKQLEEILSAKFGLICLFKQVSTN
ncbi:hypothetical protein Fot_04794 [Forsythia ovata]|uniref:Uncharacterized protein n=1 Tax=Forsythia ovata TaxID=205694 RepID=A0ABD1PGT4_9LAMI